MEDDACSSSVTAVSDTLSTTVGEDDGPSTDASALSGAKLSATAASDGTIFADVDEASSKAWSPSVFDDVSVRLVDASVAID